MKLPLSPAPSLICDVVARYVLRLRKVKGGKVCSGMKPWPHSVLKKYYFFSFSSDSGMYLPLRSYIWSGRVIAVQSSEMALERLWAGGGCFLQSCPQGRERSSGNGDTSELSFQLSLFTLSAETKEGTCRCCSDRKSPQWHWQLKADTPLSLCQI